VGNTYHNAKDKSFKKYKCLISNCSKPEMLVQHKSGYTNLRCHFLAKCHFLANHASNSLAELDLLVESSSSNKISSHFAVVSKYDEAMFGTLQYLIMKNRPLADIQCPEFRALSIRASQFIYSAKTSSRNLWNC
jgi:hypothetical protein